MSPRPVAGPQARGASADELQEVQITPRYIGPGAEIANARLDNNPVSSIRSGSEVTPDDLRRTENIPDNPEPGFGLEPLEGVIVTASQSNLDLAPTSVQVVIGSEIWQQRRALNYAAAAVVATTQMTPQGRLAAGAVVAGVALTEGYKAYQRSENPNFVSDGPARPWSLESPNPGPIKPLVTTSPPSDPLNPVLPGLPNTGPDRGSIYDNPYHDPIGRTTLESPITTGVDPGLVMFNVSERAARKGYYGVETTPQGGPTFANTDYLYPVEAGQQNIVSVPLTGSRRGDFQAANERAGLTDYVLPGASAPQGYIWHHVDDFDPLTGRATLELVQQGAHEATFPHRGSVRQYEEFYGVDYKR